MIEPSRLYDSSIIITLSMYWKTSLLAPAALGVIVGASKNARDIDPCAQITRLVADANENKCTSS